MKKNAVFTYVFIALVVPLGLFDLYMAWRVFADRDDYPYDADVTIIAIALLTTAAVIVFVFSIILHISHRRCQAELERLALARRLEEDLRDFQADVDRQFDKLLDDPEAGFPGYGSSFPDHPPDDWS
jgi:hypothetical protein